MSRRLALAATGLILLGGCGSQTVKPTAPPAADAPVPLATSLVTAQASWAIAEMGGPESQEENFWQLFARKTGSTTWQLVTPPAVADNGGLVAAGNAAALLIGFRPSQALVFSPLATSTDTGKNWAPGVLGAALANVPDALSIGPSGQELALASDGNVETSAGQAGGAWQKLTSVKALAASAAGQRCGLTGVDAMSFWPDGKKVVAGSCARRGVAGVFTEGNGTWQADGPALPVAGQVRVLRLSGSTALLTAGGSLFAAWYGAGQWTVSGPLAGAGRLRASGFGAGGSAWVLLSDGRADAISGPGGSWQALPAGPAGTAVLAAGAGSAYDALAVSGKTVTVWRLTGGSWAKVQAIDVPIAAGSSG